jgi:hypothetical protein
MPAWWLGSLSSARRTVLFKAVSDQDTTLLIGLNPTILVGLAAVAANLLKQKAAYNFQSFGYGSGSWV